MECYWDKFTDFNEEQFAAEPYFQQWVMNPGIENNAFWQAFLEENPNKKAIVNKARKKVLLSGGEFLFGDLSVGEKDDLKSAIFQELNLNIEQKETVPQVKKSFRKIWLAAALFCGFAGIAAIVWNFNKQPDNKIASIVRMTSPLQVEEIVLPDSSVVILNGNSSIAYSLDMAGLPYREVSVTGNAYFKVKKNALQPFIVHANQIKIEVTGTEFNVDARTTATDVVLTKGSINISLPENTQTKAVQKAYLSPGEKFRLDTLKHKYVTEKINTELYTAAWEKGEWQFEETTLETVAYFIKEYYGMDVIFEDKQKKNLMITAVISVSDFQTLVSILEKTLSLNIEVKNQQLNIY